MGRISRIVVDQSVAWAKVIALCASVQGLLEVAALFAGCTAGLQASEVSS